MSLLGIDLGTTYSCVARIDDRSHIDVITFQRQNKPMVPSVVSFRDDGTPFVGQAAKNDLLVHEDKAIDSVKREMNKEYCDKMLNIDGILRKVSPMEPSACILRHMFYNANKELVETYHEDKCSKAVITIPASFNDVQREKTKTSAELAGIDVIGLLQEPTAAAIAYNIKPEETILVFDLGGGTLDVSVVKYEKNAKNSYVVLGTPAGDDHLGGKDWDEALVCHVLRKVNIDPSTINKHGRIWAQLMLEAENRKIDLSEKFETSFEIKTSDVNKFIDIRRSEFENICSGLVQRAVKIVEKAIENTNNAPIDRFVLVGGSSRMPMIIKTLEKMFVHRISNNRLLEDWISLSDPDFAIAKGAAMYAKTLLANNKDTIKVEDKVTRSYGFQAMRGQQKVVLNLVYLDDPCIVNDRSFTLTTRRDNQSVVDVVIIENDSIDDEIVYECTNPLMYKSFKLPPNLPKGTEVNFHVNRDKNGIIHTNVECCGHEIQYLTKDIADDSILMQIKQTINKMKLKEK